MYFLHPRNRNAIIPPLSLAPAHDSNQLILVQDNMDGKAFSCISKLGVEWEPEPRSVKLGQNFQLWKDEALKVSFQIVPIRAPNEVMETILEGLQHPVAYGSPDHRVEQLIEMLPPVISSDI